MFVRRKKKEETSTTKSSSEFRNQDDRASFSVCVWRAGVSRTDNSFIGPILDERRKKLIKRERRDKVSYDNIKRKSPQQCGASV